MYALARRQSVTEHHVLQVRARTWHPSAWEPCPLLSRVLSRVLHALAQSTTPLPPLPQLLEPLAPPWYGRRSGHPSMVSSELDPTDHRDHAYEDAVVPEAASLVLQALASMRVGLRVERPARVCSIDRRFLELLVAQGPSSPPVDVMLVNEECRRYTLPVGPPLTPKRWARLLYIFRSGIDRALSAGFYRAAQTRLRLCMALYRRHGQLPPRPLVERLILTHAGLGQGHRALAWQRWLLGHAATNKEACETHIALAVQLYSSALTESKRREARRHLAQAKVLLASEDIAHAEERILLVSMWLNARALGLFRTGAKAMALSLSTRASEPLVGTELERTFAGQLTAQYRNAGRLAMDLGDLDLAIHCAERLAEIAEHYPPALERASKLFGRTGCWEQAVHLASRAIAAGLKLPRLFFHRAICLYRLKDTPGALADLDEVAQHWSRDSRVPLLRAAVLEQAGDLPGARGAYRAALALDPHRPSAWADLGRLYWLENDLPAARHALERAIELAPDNAELRSHLAQLGSEGSP